MTDNSHFQSCNDPRTQNQQPEVLIRQDYNVQISSGQPVIVPNTFQDLDLRLARMQIPDYSKAAEMAVGVSVNFNPGLVIMSFLIFHFSSTVFNPNSQYRIRPLPRLAISRGKPRSYIVLL